MKFTKRPLFYWVLKKNRGAQLFLLLVIVVSLFFRVYPLEMQKNIINIAINLKMLDKLYLYCALYMGAVLIASLMKYFINSFQAILGQKLLIELRKELYEHTLQLPLQFFHRTQAGTVISAMTAELNSIGAFLGEAIAVPITSVLTFIVFAGFMISLNPMLGLLSISIYPLELIVIPLLQKRFNKINQTRVTTTRAMANLVNEAISGVHEVQGNASYELEQSKLMRLVNRLYKIMRKLSILKYGIKFSNSLFQSVGPFLLFLFGGYMAIHGNFTIGALVAFLTAYEKVYDPWKELIVYYQSYQDSHIRYKQIMETFDLEPEYLLEHEGKAPIKLKGNINAENVGYSISDEIRLLDQVSFSLEAGKHMALIGFSGSGKSTLSLLISQLYSYSNGSITIDGHEIKDLSKKDISNNISTVAQHSFIFTGTIRENLLYSCNATYLNGMTDRLPSRKEIIEVIHHVGLEDDILRWGFSTIVPPKKAKELEHKFLKMRQIIQRDLRQEFSRAVEFYDAQKFLEHVSLGTNIIFGYFNDSLGKDSLLTNKKFRDFLKQNNLETELIELGLSISQTTISFLKDMSEDEFFFQGSPMEPQQFGKYVNMGERLKASGFEKLKKKDKEAYLALALRYTSAPHKIFTISRKFKDAIVAARHSFLSSVVNVDLEQCENGILQTDIFSNAPDTSIDNQNFIPFCSTQYLYSRTLSDNILFGTITDIDAIRGSIGKLGMVEFEKEDLWDEVMEIGLDFHVGSKGDRLSGGQKQKIALTRAFLKKSPILILDEATASLDNSSQAKIQRYLDTELKGNTTIVAVVHRLDMISDYDHIVVMKAGKLVESGNYETLINKKGILYELINN